MTHHKLQVTNYKLGKYFDLLQPTSYNLQPYFVGGELR